MLMNKLPELQQPKSGLEVMGEDASLEPPRRAGLAIGGCFSQSRLRFLLTVA